LDNFVLEGWLTLLHEVNAQFDDLFDLVGTLLFGNLCTNALFFQKIFK
jgi:hypothetical protein